jgi:Xaa-Pro aminopeptidase
MTRTIFCGSPSQRMREAYAAIRDANETVEGQLAPGITGKQAHELAERILADHGFAGKMGHGLGHGVGLEIHEEPVLSLRNDKPLEPGNVVTVEPGVYLTGEFGMRLEDFGVVTESGFDVFTQSTHDMVII